MEDIFRLASKFLKLASTDGFRILYHIRSSGGFPKPSDKNKKEWSRYWLKSEIDNGIWLTTNPIEVMYQHAVLGKVHVFKVSESLIKAAGGIHRYNEASEILFPKELWEEGLASNQIIYLGTKSESKIKSELKEYEKLQSKIDNGFIRTVDDD